MCLTYCPPDTIKVALPGDQRVHGRSYVCELCSPGMKSEAGDYIVCTDCRRHRRRRSLPQELSSSPWSWMVLASDTVSFHSQGTAVL